MIQKATKAQLGAIGTLCHRLNISPDNKEMIVYSFSEGRETSSKELLIPEALKMIQYLNEQLPQEDKGPMQGKIFYYCHQMGWTKENTVGKKVADVKRFDEWAVKYSYKKKKLNHYTYAELPTLVSQFQNVYKAFLKNL
jgi:hypothetical protein